MEKKEMEILLCEEKIVPKKSESLKPASLAWLLIW